MNISNFNPWSAMICLMLIFPKFVFGQNVGPGNSVDDFALLDQDGKFHELYYYSDRKAIIIISQGVGCPIFRQSVPYLNALQDSFESQGASFLMINANPQDDRDAIKQEAIDYAIKIPILEDKSQVITESLGITRMAEALVIDPSDWKIVYRGPISSEFGYDAQIVGTPHEYLKDAINALLRHQAIPQGPLTVKGCLVSFASDQTGVPSYNKDVVPILVDKCLQCHVKGGSAPFSMDNYEKVKGWAAMIREVIRTKRMPPWHADPYYGKFEGDLSLSPEETRTLVHWVEQGAPNQEGRDDLLKAPQEAPQGWAWGEPDVIVKFKQPQFIPATGSEEYVYVDSDRTVDQDLYIRRINWKLGNPKIVHHVFLIMQTKNSQDLGEDGTGEFGMGQVSGQMADLFVPGISPFIFPDDTGFFVPKGSKLLFGVHYVPTGKPEEDFTQVGLYLYKEKPRYLLSNLMIFDQDINIPPGEKEYKLHVSHVFSDSVTLYGLQPHMHLRGRSMRFTVAYPDGRSEILLSVDNYKFRWQRRYFLKKPKVLPAGSTLTIDSVYDNSAQNPDNPDPSADVKMGYFSTYEMCLGYVFYVKNH